MYGTQGRLAVSPGPVRTALPHDPVLKFKRISLTGAISSFSSSSSFLAPLFQNQSCDPYTPKTTACTLGNYVEYAINVTSAVDVAAGVRFAQSKNIRLVIKNTGHDLLGKSTGKGALGIWTHYLKSIDFLTYTSEKYTGPAAKLGAGVQSWEAYEAANANGLRIVGGTCPTVGMAGGYSQGGGHSMLSSLYGLSADNVLEWEAITADGEHVTATPTTNVDLYWALSGGGPGTYAVVLSMSVKVHKDGMVSAAQMTIPSANMTQDTYWKAVSAFHANLPAWVDKGGMAAYTLLERLLFIQPLSFPDRSPEEVKTLIAPFTAQLDALNITYALNITCFPNFLDHFANYFGPLPYGIYPSAEIQGSRLIPRSVVTTNNAGFTSTLREITVGGAFEALGAAMNVGRASTSPNAVLPAWRDALIELIVVAPWDFTTSYADNVEKERQITSRLVPALAELSPESGAYMNEGDPNQPNWQSTFYGANYEALRTVKKKWDSKDLFYATTAVGSEAWTVATDGRLCRSGY